MTTQLFKVGAEVNFRNRPQNALSYWVCKVKWIEANLFGDEAHFEYLLDDGHWWIAPCLIPHTEWLKL